MKFIALLVWVGQFGFSAIFPTVFFLLVAVWLQGKFGFGMWIVAVCGVLGILTSISAARSCLRSLRKAAEEASGKKDHPVSFNDHT
ncbi:MAG: hypothetical protein SPC78_03755 [Candidatus Faecousia sp.]|nr:hypothetical protein [Clostridiales bacterium]MDY4598731.1 hypothetical protein [Candidatus Faecousia sp.]